VQLYYLQTAVFLCFTLSHQQKTVQNPPTNWLTQWINAN